MRDGRHSLDGAARGLSPLGDARSRDTSHRSSCRCLAPTDPGGLAPVGRCRRCQTSRWASGWPTVCNASPMALPPSLTLPCRPLPARADPITPASSFPRRPPPVAARPHLRTLRINHIEVCFASLAAVLLIQGHMRSSPGACCTNQLCACCPAV